jgi:glyoxylase-like metal-dependent hydrolase (beta-lactamase superfamily II)
MIRRLTVGPVEANCYIVSCGADGKAVVIDPGGDGERILAELDRLNLMVAAVVNTHGHFDHVGANGLLVERTGAPLMIHEAGLPFLRSAAENAGFYGLKIEPSPEPARLLSDGDRIGTGEIGLTVIHTPGHSPGGISIFAENFIFTGDTLFAGSIGRTDLPGGDMNTLMESIRKILLLDEETIVYPGHGPSTTIGREKRSNPFLQ